ncbi:MAG: sugar porter family MFS transporter [Verrucomicrobiales bacterium]|nr:sugar porter family MFS transporter [Verrucomicrobiales bacterium]
MTPKTNAATGSARYVAMVCGVAALGGLLFGYDTAVINGAIGFLEEHFKLTAAMKGWAASSALLGCVIGVALAGGFSDRFGRKQTLLLSAVLFLVSAVGTAVPRTFTPFVIYRMLGGIGVGIASMTSPMYIAEISPGRIRGRLVSVNQLAIVGGMLAIYFINYGIVRQGDAVWQVTSSWRWMFGSEAVPALLFLGCLFLVPESPRWLIEQGRESQAKAVLERIGGGAFADYEVTAIRASVRRGVAPLSELFTAGMKRLCWVGIGLAVLQQVTGINVFLYFGAEIFKQLGSNVDAALLQQVVVGAANLAFTVVAIVTVDRLGRKPLMLVGAAGMGICLVGMGAAAQANAVGVWVLGFILGYIACFAVSVGPVTWVLLSELFPTRLRGRALGIATLFLWSANFVVSQTFPMMDKNDWLVARFNHAFPFYVYAVFCGLLVWLVWAKIPETKGRSLEEIEQELAG